MRRIAIAASVLGLVLGLTTIPGCGGGPEVSDIQESPEAKTANKSGMDGMQEYMKTKGQSKK